MRRDERDALERGSATYAVAFTVTKGTTKASPKETKLKLSAGVITEVGIAFLEGPNNEIGVRVLFHEFQIVPITPGEWILGNDRRVAIRLHFDMGRGPYEVKIISHAENADFDHEIAVDATVMEKDVASTAPLVRAITRFFNWVGAITGSE